MLVCIVTSKTNVSKELTSDKYPWTMTQAYKLLGSWIPETKHRFGNLPTNDGVAFANVGGNKTYRDIVTVKCHKCGKLGHYANNCNTPAEEIDDDKKEEPDKAHQFLNAGLDINHFDNYDDDDGTSFMFNQTGQFVTYKGVTC